MSAALNAGILFFPLEGLTHATSEARSVNSKTPTMGHANHPIAPVLRQEPSWLVISSFNMSC